MGVGVVAPRSSSSANARRASASSFFVGSWSTFLSSSVMRRFSSSRPAVPEGPSVGAGPVGLGSLPPSAPALAPPSLPEPATDPSSGSPSDVLPLPDVLPPSDVPP